jgi:hypothetical protein
MKRLPAAALLALVALPLAAGSAQATMTASTATATIGEPIELRVVVRAEPGIRAIRVEVPSGPYEVIRRRSLPPVAGAGKRTFAEIITVAFFRTGDFTVGPVRVALRPAGSGAQAEATGQLAIHIRSLLDENDKDIKPLKGPLPLRGDPRHLLPYAAALLLALLLAAVVLLLLRRRRRAAARPAPPPLPPELELEREARELRERHLWPAGEYRVFFIALSGMLKRFLARAYGFNADECTSAETVAGLREREHDAGIVAALEETFALADLVKFARRAPDAGAEAGIWRRLESLIAEHKERRRRAEEAAHAAPGR